ncbi:hypothetical protein TSOC_007626 [Tetrabaena socialis]|uniref:Nucleoporin NDC1 n=1 Tax=Tetrabaena socialis TaxID=47790 RepID=A0A2J8A0L5_9CHLO|nr:hypothetical protein TSOC_007626 [Tetrabaena socialis]|eukprot:PNH06060.1 hypothetical protein TSOC_007626 [Tetrabaena socialis]
MPPASPQPEALKWKLIGALVWHAAAISAANTCFAFALPPSVSTLFRPAGALTHLLLYGLQVCALLGHRAILASNEFEPVTFAKLGIHGRTWISLLLTRVLVRGRTWSHLVATATFFGANILSAVAYATLYAGMKLGGSAAPLTPWSLCFGALLGACYSCSYLVRGCDVLSYPPLQRHRWFRLKERLPAALRTAAYTTFTALALAAAAHRSLLLQPRLLYGWAVSGLLCALCWSVGGALLQLVFSERLHLARLGDPDPNAPLLAELVGGNAIMQDLALLDLALTAEGHGGEAAWRRAAIFADESGRAAWGPLSAHMLGEVRDFTAALAAALPSAAAEAAATARPGAAGAGSGSSAASAAAVRWNVLRMSPSTGLRVVSREQDLAAWNVRSKYHRLGWCLRGLAGLTVAAQRGEDRYGVVLLCEPSLADIAVGLLAAVLALQQYTKFVVATRSRHASPLERLARQVGLVSTAIAGRVTNVTLQPVEEVAFALEAVARNCVNRLAAVYGSKLRDCVLREARAKPACGSVTDLAAVLTSVL